MVLLSRFRNDTSRSPNGCVLTYLQDIQLLLIAFCRLEIVADLGGREIVEDAARIELSHNELVKWIF